MKLYTTEKIRNIGLFGHGGSGKTSFAEAALFHTGANSRIGKVDDDSSVMNYDPEEIKRKATVGTSLAALEYKDHKINLLDAPGVDDFLGEVHKIIGAVDVAILFINAAAGLEVGAEKNWKILEDNNVSRIVYLSKLDKENINLQKVLDELKAFDSKITPVIIPWGTHENLKGVIDLVNQKAYAYTDDKGKTFQAQDIPADQMDLVNSLREPMIESIVECDEELMNKFFEGEEISPAELKSALKKGVANNEIKPLVSGMALRNLGTEQVLDFIIESCPSPVEAKKITAVKPGTDEEIKLEAKADGPVAGFIFKKINEQAGDMIFLRAVSGTFNSGVEYLNPAADNFERFSSFSTLRGKNKIDIEKVVAGDIVVLVKPKCSTHGHTLCEKSNPIQINVPKLPEPKLTYAVNPKTKQDQEKMGTGLHTLCADDGVLSYKFDPELGQGLLSGLGDTHIDVTISKLKSRWGVEVDISKPKVPYRETIKGKSRVQGKHKKQSGGRGQYGDVWIRFEPNPGKDFEFVDEIVGGVVPKNFIPAVEKGLQEARRRGVLAGFLTIDFKATLDFGSYHDVDSSEMAFKVAASLAFKKGIAEAKPVLLEPIYEVAVEVPDEYMGAIIGDLNSRRGRILGMEPQGATQIVKALVPLAEMYKYATDLKSMTQSRADFTMNFSTYEEVPANVTDSVIKEYKTEDEAEA
ncbi:MAG: elongation factor [Clostridiales bacterium]|nr:elongation factor [Clostridiales bacterium]MDN5282760.1 elongation factor [Candidatus Ozemobacter sp.]